MSGLLTVTISCCFFVLIPCKFSCIPFPLFSLLSQFLAFFCHDSMQISLHSFSSIFTTVIISRYFLLSRFHANFPAFLSLYFQYCYNFSLFFFTTVTISCCFFVTIPCKFPCIPFIIFSLLSQFLVFFYCHDSMQISLHSLSSIFTAVTFYCCFFVTIPCKFPCIPCPLFSLLSQFSAVFLSRFHANFPAFLSLYFHYCHNIFAVFFFFYCHDSMQISSIPYPLFSLLSQFLAIFCHDSMQISLHSFPSIFTTVTISCCLFSVTIPCKFPCIPYSLFSLLSQFLAVFLSRFHANFPAFLSLYFHYCHNVFAVFFFFYCHDSMQISLHSLPSFITTVTISCCFSLHVILSSYFLS